MMYGFQSPPNQPKKKHTHASPGIITPWRRVALAAILVFIVSMVFLWMTVKDENPEEQTGAPYTITVPDEMKVATPRIILLSAPSAVPAAVVASRGGSGGREPVIMECTAYTLRPKECGKEPGDPWYGITASGEHVQSWYTVAADKDIPFGTRLYIPFFKDKPNGGMFVVQDRGGVVGPGQIDIYIKDLDDALEFGRCIIEVYFLGEE